MKPFAHVTINEKRRKTIFRSLSTDLICILKNQLKKRTFNYMMTILLPLFDVELHLMGVIFAVEADDERDWVPAGELVIWDAGC